MPPHGVVTPPATSTASSLSALASPNEAVYTQPAGKAPLKRNNACITCRKKKVRCDGVRPACGPCRRSADVYHEDALSLCAFPEDAAASSTSPHHPGKRKTVAALESRIAELELQVDAQNELLAEHRAAAGLVHTNGTLAGGVFSSPVFDSPFVSGPPGSVSSLASSPQATSIHSPPSSNGHLASPKDLPLPTQPHPAASGPSSTSDAQASAPPVDSLFELLYPGWPSDLPAPPVVNYLVTNFFASGLVVTRMVNASSLLASLQLPPISPAFPHPALLHAICAATAVFVPESSLGTPYWGPERGQSPSGYHATCAKRNAERWVSSATGRHLLQICQALHLISLQSFSSAKFLDAWSSIGQVMRLIPPLGLNHLDQYDPESLSAQNGSLRSCSKPALLDPPADPAELLERTVTFWQAFCCDRFMAACTGWAVSMDESDITSPLPALPYVETGSLFSSYSGCLHPSSPEFFARHCTSAALAPIQLATKGAIVLGRVATWLQRKNGRTDIMLTNMAGPMGMGAGARMGSYSSMQQGPEFAKLDEDLRTLRTSMARDFSLDAIRGKDGTRTDPCLVGAFLIPHAAVILLHEPFIQSSNDPSMAKAMAAARAISSILHLCTAMGEVQYLSLAYPFVNFCWAVSGRTLVREIAFALLDGDDVREATARAEIDMILNALAPFALLSSLGKMCDGMIRGMLEDPQASIMR